MGTGVKVIKSNMNFLDNYKIKEFFSIKFGDLLKSIYYRGNAVQIVVRRIMKEIIEQEHRQRIYENRSKM